METLIKDAESFVTHYLNDHLDPNFVYHNLAHTQRVVSKVEELIEDSKLSENEKLQLRIAAWFHDVGFTKQIKNHEKESVKIATKFLVSKDVSQENIDGVAAIIMATEMSYEPKNELEGLIRDADSAHISSKNYANYASLLRKEWELTSNKKFSKSEWLEENIKFLSNHTFYTAIATSKWESRKGKNLAKLIQSQNKIKSRTEKLKQKKAELKFKQEKLELPDRGIETMFRVALRNHITLSDIADTKANILLSVNAIIISVAISNLLPKLDNPSNTYLIYPTLIFMISTVASIILSVMATRPNVTKGKFTKEDVADRKVNLLFFGNFHQMKLDEFEWAMQEMMKDKEYLYGSLTKDLYFLGLVLNRKYNLLRTTYTVFIVGLVISVIAFAVSFSIAEVA
ncbi:putative metal-dependent HD superfamily phosphohydrolase [Winogradskyella wandonensis]|uniref:Putative metal-dependent HD superfamily phosphohydrolase n=1 Tax=Winogradskyella wandonensis TaxID=1442586 RepID=A0A4R1KKC9_9FLAO|nr:Pycsar system effector family protein [Winogradskyella wandonensis]TCK65204.1 putative metal-dependent HD superfamily phosphohydrolase [Winogradskyella wandonensis]